MTKHAEIRAMQRYNVCDFDSYKILSELRKGNCIEIKLTNSKKGRRKFVVQYNNKYLVVIAEKKLRAICTVLPYNDEYFDAVCELVEKKQKTTLISKKKGIFKLKSEWKILFLNFWIKLLNFLKNKIKKK